MQRLEVMVATPAIRHLVRENKTYQIPNHIQTGTKFGMQSMDQELVNLYRQGIISRDSVLSRCSDYEYTCRLVGVLDINQVTKYKQFNTKIYR